MKRLLLTLSLTAILFSVNGKQNKGLKIIDIIETSANKTEIRASSTIGSEQLTKDQFILKIWDYYKSPKDWKYLGDKPAIVDFYADWCGPCKIAGPILEEIGAEYFDKIHIYKINTDQERELAQVFGITGIPAFLYIPAKGRPTMMSGIGRSKEDTKKMFIENIEKYLLVKK